MSDSDLDLYQIIKDGRHTKVDWFSEQTPLGQVATTMTAMANTQGGMILMANRDAHRRARRRRRG
jgi:hypothetical protein